MSGKLAKLIVICLVLAYFASGSILPYFLFGQISPYLIAIYVTVVIAAAYMLVKMERILFTTVFMIGTLGVSVMTSLYPQESLLRWIGWIMMVTAVGPLVVGESATAFRATAWRTINFIIHVITLASLVWFLARLPKLGRGAFTGLTHHSMILAPLAGVAAVLAFNRAMCGKSKIWLLITAGEAFVCVLAGSRVATISMLFGISVIVILWLHRRAAVASVLVCCVVAIVVGTINLESVAIRFAGWLPVDVAQRYERGLENTRTALWRERLTQFKAYPIVGTGFTVHHKVIDRASDVAGEPGSSYLVLISTTGLLGAAGFGIWAVIMGLRLKRFSPGLLAQDRSLLYGLSAFWLLHMVAEGYLFSVGSPMALCVWAWLGQLYDLTAASQMRITPQIYPEYETGYETALWLENAE